jgi:hypothetical protein
MQKEALLALHRDRLVWLARFMSSSGCGVSLSSQDRTVSKKLHRAFLSLSPCKKRICLLCMRDRLTGWLASCLHRDVECHSVHRTGRCPWSCTAPSSPFLLDLQDTTTHFAWRLLFLRRVDDGAFGVYSSLFLSTTASFFFFLLPNLRQDFLRFALKIPDSIVWAPEHESLTWVTRRLICTANAIRKRCCLTLLVAISQLLRSVKFPNAGRRLTTRQTSGVHISSCHVCCTRSTS